MVRDDKYCTDVRENGLSSEQLEKKSQAYKMICRDIKAVKALKSIVNGEIISDPYIVVSVDMGYSKKVVVVVVVFVVVNVVVVDNVGVFACVVVVVVVLVAGSDSIAITIFIKKRQSWTDGESTIDPNNHGSISMTIVKKKFLHCSLRIFFSQ